MTDIDFDNLPPSSMPTTVGFSVQGFNDEDVATRLAYAVADVVRVVGSFINLDRLDGVTIACDYDQALAQLDRGIDGLRPLIRSNTEEMQGVAMSPAVMRDGEVRTHLVFNAAYVATLVLDDATEDDRILAYGVISHECAHVEITAAKERAIPDARFGTPIEGFEHAVMFQIAEICWDEYAACRMSAMFNRDQNERHAVTVIAAVKVARENSDNAIRSYRTHGDVDQLLAEAGPWLHQPIKAAAYLLGGMDADEADWSDFPEVKGALEDECYFEIVGKLRAELRRLWNTRGEWAASLDVFQGLEAIAKEVFEEGGLFFSTDLDGNCRIDVPFTPHTMPYN